MEQQWFAVGADDSVDGHGDADFFWHGIGGRDHYWQRHVDVGTAANKIVQLNGSAQLPAVDGSLLTNVNVSSLNGNVVKSGTPNNGEVLSWNNSGSRWDFASVASPSGVTGAIQVSNGSGAFASNNNIVIDTANGLLGVGTNAPQAVLDVVSTVSGKSAIIVPRDSTANRPLTGVNGMIRYNTSTGAFEGFQNGSWTNMITGATAFPLLASPTGTASAPAYSFNGSAGTGLYSDATDVIGLSTAGSQRLKIDQLGNVAIGSNSQIYVTSVGRVGIGVTPTMSQLEIGPRSGSYSNVSTIASFGGSNSGGTVYGLTLGNQANGALNNEAALTFTPGGNYSATAQVSAIVTHGAWAYTDLRFLTYKTSLTEGMRLTYDGRVGIGTASPQALLDLSTTTSGYSALIVPRDSTVNRPATGINGMIRYNTNTNKFEAFENSAWVNMTPSGAGASSSGNAGAVQVSGGSGAFTSNNNIFVDTTNGRLGIGTPAPGMKLDVNGDVRVLGSNYLYFNTNGEISYQSNWAANGNQDTFLIDTGSSEYLTLQSGVSPITLRTNSTERMRIDQLGNVAIGTSSQLYVKANGNIGMGVLNPRAKTQINMSGPPTSLGVANEYLHLGGSEQAANGYRLIGFGMDTSGEQYSPAYMGFLETNAGASGKGVLVFGTRDSTTDTVAPTERMRIGTDGLVGIGTTTPQALLDLVTTTSGQSALIVPRDTSANRPATGVNGMIRYNTNTSAFEGFANGAWGTLDVGGASQWNNGASSSINYTAGYVGVGIASPGNTLDVSGTARIGTGQYSTSYPLSVQGSGASTWLEILNNGGTNKGVFFGISGNDFQQWNYQGGDISFWTNQNASVGTERMRITKDGNIGIGTAAPNGKLSIYAPKPADDQTPTIGSSSYYSGNLSSGEFIPYKYQSTVDNATLGSNPVYGNSYETFISGTTSTSNVVYNFYSRPYMQGSGSVSYLYGFTVDPYFWGASASGSIGNYVGLNLSGGAYGGGASGSVTNHTQIAVRNTSTPSTNKIGLWIDDITGASASNYAIYSTGGTNYFGGNVGIGSVSPQVMLDIASTGSGRSAIIVPRDTTANRPATGVNGMIRYNTNTSTFEGFSNGSWTSFATGSASQWNNGASSSINYTAGYVGVGIGTPSAPLDVGGGEMRIQSSGIAGGAFTKLTSEHNSGATTLSINVSGPNAGVGHIVIGDDPSIDDVSIPSKLKVGNMYYYNKLSGLLATFGDDNRADRTFMGFTNTNAIHASNYAIGWSPIGYGSDFSNATSDTGISRLASGKIGFGNGAVGDSSATIIAGKVGIGTTTPAENLEVVGNAKISGTITASQSFATLTDGATITWTVAGLVNNGIVTLGGNRILAFSGLTNGMSGTLIVKQDGSGTRTLTLPSQCTNKVINGGSAAITLSTAPNAIDILSFVYDGTNCYWTYGKNYN